MPAIVPATDLPLRGVSAVARAVITLVIPFYSGREFLRRAVESVRAQRDDRWRLIVCDDGGDDGTAVRRLLDGYADPRIRYIPPADPPGMAANWNRCLSVAETDLVALPHADDELLPDFVGRMADAAGRHPNSAALFCEARIIGPDGRPRFSFPDFVKRFLRPAAGRTVRLRNEAGLRAVMRGNFIMCPTMCFRLSRLADRRFDPRWRQVLDLDLIARLLLAGEELVGLPDVLYAYRRHPANATAEQTKTLLRFREERDLFAKVAEAATAERWHRAAAVARHGCIIRMNLAFCILVDVLARRWADARRKADLLTGILR